jgi:hypothetical protein
MGHDMRSHLRSEVHGYLAQPWLAPAGAAPIDKASVEQRIRDAKQKLPE